VELETDARWTAARYLQINNEPFSRAWSYTVVNSSIALAADDDTWRISIWGKNVFNKDYLTYINNIAYFKIDIHGEPATFGVSGSLRF
jgi:iron complex outermembrane receptor protein